MPFGSVLVATCLSSALACVLMGLLARYPFALAPGMGENFFFAFTVCSTFPGAMGFSWPAGLTIVLAAGLIFVALSLFGVREKLMDVLPDCLKNAIGPAIGLFIAFVGFQWGGIVRPHPATMVCLGDLGTGPALLTVFGVLLMSTLMALGVRAGIFIGILATCAVGEATGVAAGARTGLAAVTTGVCFVLALFLAPVIQVVGHDIAPALYGLDPASPHVAMYPGVAPALIVVGFLMMRPLGKVKWEDITESLPAFVTITMMVFSFAIHEGIAMGCISFVAIKTLTGRGREVHPIMAAIALALVARYALYALR